MENLNIKKTKGRKMKYTDIIPIDAINRHALVSNHIKSVNYHTKPECKLEKQERNKRNYETRKNKKSIDLLKITLN